MKRLDLAIRAIAAVPAPARLVLVGDGSQRAALEQLAADVGARDRVTFAGSVDGDELVRLYADARAVIYTPFDEDFGYVTLEAFLSGKPVITAHDSGGTLEFVVEGVNGFVCAPDHDAIAGAAARLAADESLARRLGAAGQTRARTITWTDPARTRFQLRNHDGYERLAAMKRGEASPPPAVALLGLDMDELERGRTVFSLDQFGCLCSTMFRVSPNHLLWILEELIDGRVHNRIVVPDEQKHWNRVALERMLSIQ